MELGDMSKRQPDRRADNNRRPPKGPYKHREKIPHLEVVLIYSQRTTMALNKRRWEWYRGLFTDETTSQYISIGQL